MNRAIACIAVIFLVSPFQNGCLGPRCGPDEEYRNDMCIPLDGGSGQDGSSTGDNDIAGLGETCSEQEDCTGQANLCVVMPGDTIGYCTIQECDEDANDCPEGFFCMDISIYIPDLTTICLKE